MPNSLHPSFICLFLLNPHPFSDVFGLKVQNVVETCVSLNNVDVCMVIQHVGKGEEITGVDEDIFIGKLVGGVKGKAFLGAGVHSGR